MISTFKRCVNWNFASLKRTLSSSREDHKVYWTKYAKAMAKAPKSRRAQELIESHGINWDTWKAFCSPLCTIFLQNPISFVETHCAGSDVDFNNIFRTHKPSKRSTGRTTPTMEDLFVRSILLPMYYRDENVVDSLEHISSATDLRAPHEWYPETRSMVRKIVFHCGPTNSGKTYHALRRLSEAPGGGLYCGPLRMLAHEVFEKLNKQGVATNLRTGQELREVPDATHVSSTIEMANLGLSYNVAVIDEIQMIADLQRGDSWSRALLGVKAAEVHLCGGPEALPVVESLLASTQDTLEVIRYERATPLQIEEESLKGDYAKVQPGDCIIAFSKKDIFSIRREIEERTNLKCAVVYGQLPPETRAAQARLFNEENTGYDILVASDAIGMGLNLNIRRIIFHTTAKLVPQPKGKLGTEYISPSQLKQIAGRAGRMASKYEQGLVTAWQEMDLAYVRAVMQHDVPAMKTAGVLPSADQVLELSRYLDQQCEVGEKSEKIASNDGEVGDDENIELLRLLRLFVNESQMSKKYHLCFTQAMLRIARLLDTLPLTLGEKYHLMHAPLGRSEEEEDQFLEWLHDYADKRPVPLGVTVPAAMPPSNNEFQLLCSQFGVLDLYLWLEMRYPMHFHQREECLEQREIALYWIDQYLQYRPTEPNHTAFKSSYHYQHHFSYGEIRNKLGTKRPAAEHPHIQNSVKQHIRSVPEKDLLRLRGKHAKKNIKSRREA